MDHLSSCYFCGTALDETLRDYRVVPVELRDTDDATTATLCQSCHGNETAEAADSEGATEPADEDESANEEETPLEKVEANLVDIDEEPLTEGDETVPAETGSDDEGAGAETGGSEDEETVRVRHETGDEGGNDETEAGADDGGETARTTVSALEYNKVMRLLQNREFPVDREGFERVAANAYGLAEHECGEVIDLAIDRGLVAERDGQLVRPE
ncbi:hypothetical protein BRD09_04860 [Halobacteriales archaeon SW_10_68_16]|nr:MAG: hypothetical protein BRD09_04860 [Halobacteriales archaeon SW_10_68_16]